MPALHHVELRVSDLERAGAEWEWLLGEIGWIAHEPVAGTSGRSWSHPDGTRLYLESGPGVDATVDPEIDPEIETEIETEIDTALDSTPGRGRPGVDHLAFTAESRDLLDRIRSASTEHGWHELYADRYPHAGGPERTALYLESSEGFEVEVVVD